MTAMILSAGRGERMRPLSDTVPKPLLKVKGKPLIVWHIEKLASLGFDRIVINIDHLGEMIKKALGNGSKWGVRILYSDERESGALESAGGIKNALTLIASDNFLVLNADIWCDYKFEKDFKLKEESVHLILVPNPQHNPCGDFVLHKGKILNTGTEKFTFSGIGYYCVDLFKDIEMQKAPLAPLLREAAKRGRAGGTLYKGTWVDVGTPQRLQELNAISV